MYVGRSWLWIHLFQFSLKMLSFKFNFVLFFNNVEGICQARDVRRDKLSTFFFFLRKLTHSHVNVSNLKQIQRNKEKKSP